MTKTPINAGLIERKQSPLDGAWKQQSSGLPISQGKFARL
jgi:hypothetical protein